MAPVIFLAKHKQKHTPGAYYNKNILAEKKENSIVLFNCVNY
ncbi:MAG: hypothetical protein RLZZ309_716, partial [Bacteroidota bacterium]